MNELEKNIKTIFGNLKKTFNSKDKKVIVTCIGNILFTLFIVIILKMPIVFVKTLILDFLNSINITYSIQNVISVVFELSYVLLAAIVIYKYFKKYFGNN